MMSLRTEARAVVAQVGDAAATLGPEVADAVRETPRALVDMFTAHWRDALLVAAPLAALVVGLRITS